MSSLGRFKRKAKANMRSSEFQKIQKTPLPSRENVDEMEGRVNELSNAENQRMQGAREGFKKEALEDISTQVPGMTPAQKQAMQETANKQISGQVQNYSRLLSSKMGQQGIRGGAANSVQAELMDQGLQARNQFLRDFTEKEAEAQNQKLAAYITSLEGKTAQDLLQRQQQRDYLTGLRENTKQDAYAQYFNKYFNTI
jgi:hypothetical protein